MKRFTLVAGIILLAASMGAVAQEKQSSNDTITLKASDSDVKDILKQVGEKAKIKIFADSTVTGKASVDLSSKTIDESLKAICDPLKLSWKVVYLAQGTMPQADNVSQLVRTLDAMQATGMMVMDRTTSKATALVKDAVVTSQYEAGFQKKGSGYSPVYLVYNPKISLSMATKKSTDGTSWKTGDPMGADQYTQVSKESLDALMNMSPEDQRQAIQQTMDSQMETMINNPQLFQMFMKEGMRMQYDIVTKHPEFLGQMMQGAMQANIDMLRNMTPEQRQQMMQNQIELMKSIPPEQLQEMMELMAPPQPK